jgi:hypothetical protein
MLILNIGIFMENYFEEYTSKCSLTLVISWGESQDYFYFLLFVYLHLFLQWIKMCLLRTSEWTFKVF